MRTTSGILILTCLLLFTGSAAAADFAVINQGAAVYIGEVGLNVWVEENGDLQFYISRTDAWSEACRLLKLCRFRLKIDPNPWAAERLRPVAGDQLQASREVGIGRAIAFFHAGPFENVGACASRRMPDRPK